MLWFSQRAELGRMVEVWMEANGILNCPASTIGYLVSNGLINEEKAREFLKKEKNHGTSL